MMSMGRWQGVCEETSLTLPSRKRLISASTNDLAGNGLSGMISNTASSSFDSRALLTLVKTVLTFLRTAGSFSSLRSIFHLWSLKRKSESSSHPCHGGANPDWSLDDGPLSGIGIRD
jgi:hypothetical protein